MHSSIDPWRAEENEDKLQEVIETHSESFSDSITDVRSLRQYDGALALAKLLIVPDTKEPIDHTRDLSLAAKKGYEANATHSADKQHAAARILADYYGFDWKNDIIAKDEDRLGEL